MSDDYIVRRPPKSVIKKGPAVKLGVWQRHLAATVLWYDGVCRRCHRRRAAINDRPTATGSWECQAGRARSKHALKAIHLAIHLGVLGVIAIHLRAIQNAGQVKNAKSLSPRLGQTLSVPSAVMHSTETNPARPKVFHWHDAGYLSAGVGVSITNEIIARDYAAFQLGIKPVEPCGLYDYVAIWQKGRSFQRFECIA